MSSFFVSENNGASQLPEPTRPKRPRSSLACIRCRKKKVKCDFVQPTCNRCAAAGLPCSYATPPRRVDGHAFDQLGNHVEELKERMQKMQAELALMKHNLHPFSPTPTLSATCASNDPTNLHDSTAVSVVSTMATQIPLTIPPSLSQPSVTWKLSLSPSGLRIDTNIASVADLYRILLNGISQLNVTTDPSISLFGTPEAIKGVRDRRRHINDDGGSIDDCNDNSNTSTRLSHQSGGNASGGRVWEVDENEARKLRKVKVHLLPKTKMDHLMHTCYNSCFVAYQIVDKAAFTRQYINEELDPLLSNSINAWMSKHGCIYHGVEEAYDPVTMGEEYFNNARQLLKKCFDISSPTTIHALLHLYMYQLNSERSNMAYLYIGLAIRMAQDLKYHKKDYMSSDMQQRETNKRLWWSAYWLDLSAALESNRPTMVDDKDCDVDYPAKLDSEDEETGYRLSFCTCSIKLMRIRKDITKHLPVEQSGQSLLSAISRLENTLTHWLNDLPRALRFTEEQQQQFNKDSNSDQGSSTSFRRDAMLILNVQYQTTWIMLHQLFLPKQGHAATPVALLSLNICTKSANAITKMLATQRLKWCHFGFALDGVIASVAIHQLNALSNETGVACLAQRNLIITADLLRNCPLIYMDRINSIIESIQAFFKKNNLSDNLNDVPPVNEDSVNRQSISSVFHPDEFEAPGSSSSSSSLQQEQNEYHSALAAAPKGRSHHHLEVPITVSSGMSSSAASLSPNSSTASLLTSPI
ncbi:fungal-specific transcription factor domain-containing protein, partial [Zychaea mexicana]|uniref:fungal-specific transcription factor domain-containing protein n=1 Tax=Zychaea mexicana TaxID=64656 RepID=UPI0022FEC079